MIRAEQKILQDLNYNIPRPTRSYFLERFLLVSRVDCLDLESRRQLKSPLHLRNHCDCVSPSLSFTESRTCEGTIEGGRDDEEEISPINSVECLLPHLSPNSSQSWMTTPIKPTNIQRSNSLSSIFEESDLTSNESQSVLSPSSSSLGRQIIYSYPTPPTPLHGYVPSNERFKREESFAKMLLLITLQVDFFFPFLFCLLY